MSSSCLTCSTVLDRDVYHGQLVKYCSSKCRSRAFNASRVADGRLRTQRLAQRTQTREYAKANPRRARYPETTAAADARRRARKAGVAAETFTRAEIFERDGWVCGICSQPVDSLVAYPELLSPSLDHIVPISRGGGHVRSNVQLAHLGCNLSKGARLLTAV